MKNVFRICLFVIIAVLTFYFATANVWTANGNDNSTTVINSTGNYTVYNGTGINDGAIAFDGANMWTANYDSNSVTRINSSGGMINYTGTGLNPDSIAFDGHNMWTASYIGNSVTKINSTGNMTNYTGTVSQPIEITFDGTNMWVVGQSGGLTKVSPSGNMTNYTLHVNVANSLTFDGRYLWVTDVGDTNIVKFDPVTTTQVVYNQTTNIPFKMAFDGTNMWASNFASNSVTKILPDGTFIQYNYTVNNPSAITFDGTYIWVAGGFVTDNSVTRINSSGGMKNFTINSFTGTNVAAMASNTTLYSYYLASMNFSTSPQNFVGIIQTGQNYTFNVTIQTTFSPETQYNLTCLVPSGFTCNMINNITLNGSGIFLVNINSSAGLADNTYLGNITITRLTDNKSLLMNLSLGISTLFGEPFINNIVNYAVSMYSDEVITLSYNLTNIGTGNLTNCTGSLSQIFVGKTFYSFNTLNLTNGSSDFFNITFFHPSTGLYFGQLQIDCVATASGIHNQLNVTNMPTETLLVVTRPVIPTGGGSGGPVIVANNTAPFTVVPNVVDVWYIITDFTGKKTNIWNYTLTTSKVLDSCIIDNGFTCKVFSNTVQIDKDYTGVTYITNYESGNLKLLSGTDALSKTINVRIVNLGYYVPFQSTSYPSFLEGWLIIVNNGLMIGVLLVPVLAIFLAIILIYNWR